MLDPNNVPRAVIRIWSNRELISVVATTSPTGIYRDQVKWAKEELTRRHIDFSGHLPA